jgi:hypothetical protein
MTYCTGSLSGDQRAAPWPSGVAVQNGQPCSDSVGSFFEEYEHPSGPEVENLPPGGWYRVG